ncbi:MAG TPA: hypothetical protein VN380_10345, partial [Thermoanaerobaculia bacterium]|nr:hypothetical protein [Thermoanaerobaculia bacterium]
MTVVPSGTVAPSGKPAPWRLGMVVRAITYIAIVIVAGASVGIAASRFPSLAYMWVALFGGAVGAGELIARYRDDPWRAVTRSAALFYLFINVTASIGALKLIEIFKWLPRADASEQTSMRVLVAGFGAMAFFRSSLFLTRVGNQDVQIGPVSFLQIFLAAADRQVDRNLGETRSSEAEELMAAVNFEKAADVLPIYCMTLMQNVADVEQAQIANDVARLRERTIDNQTKAMMLGLRLMTTVGKAVLRTAVTSLARQIKDVVRISIEPI